MVFWRNLFWQSGEKFLKLLFGLITGLLIARTLGPEDYGVLKYIQTLVLVFLPISTLGLEAVFIKRLIKYFTPQDVSAVISLRILSYLVILVILSVIVYNSGLGPRVSSLILFFSSIHFFASFDSFLYLFKAKNKSKPIFIASITSTLIGFVSRITIVLFANRQIEYLLFISILEVVISVIILGYYANQAFFLRIKLFANFSTIKSLFKSSWKMAIIASSILLFMKIDQLMIQHMLGFKEVGIYSVAVMISELWYFIPISIMSSAYPLIAEKMAANNTEWKDISRNTLALIIIISGVIIFGIKLISTSIIPIVFGSEYNPSVSLIQIYAFNGLFIGFGLIQDKIHLLKGEENVLLLKMSIGLILNIILNYQLILNIGIEGAAYSTLITLGIVNLILDLFTNNRDLFYLKLESFALILKPIRIIKSLKKYGS